MGSLQHAVVTAAILLTGSPKARCVFFKISGDVMKPVSFNSQEGRAEPSDTVFKNESSDIAGEAMFRLVRSGKFAQYDDILEKAPEGMQTGRSYRTFIAVSVTAGDEQYGALSIDSPAPNSFGERDVQIMRMLANLLGSGLALMPEGA
ncbi:GAF domain-containing protein [Nonomuraea sp. FMUSA5-5]|uniref:GAF domain-containing protein n=1 Tax=Nonomuraea composti TaxID=2720023 RepID=A0ABX1BMF9_9ACTN|nr:GAF domain-containing protein [Nonomuraea sp. FMUSA5-5]NJP96441.1 GAF domain-containing protein [Nonomuraea sp. FMUSA5-5]